MDNYIAVAIIALILILAAVASVKHFKGEGGCCGGGLRKPRRKRLPRVTHTRVFHVEGMHCKNCRARVEEIVNDCHGLAGRVDLKSGRLTVRYAEEVGDEVIIAKLARAGYTVSAEDNIK